MNSASKQGKQGGQNDSLDFSYIEDISPKKPQQVWDISMIEVKNEPEDFLNEEESRLYQLETNSTITLS